MVRHPIRGEISCADCLGVSKLCAARKKTDSKSRKTAGPAKGAPKKGTTFAKKVANPKLTTADKAVGKKKSASSPKSAYKPVTKTESAPTQIGTKKPIVGAKPVPKTTSKKGAPAKQLKASKNATKPLAEKSTPAKSPKAKPKKGIVSVTPTNKPKKIHAPIKSAVKPAAKSSKPVKQGAPKGGKPHGSKKTKPAELVAAQQTTIAPPPKAKKKLPPPPPPSNTNPEIVAKIRSAQAEKELRKDLAQPAPKPSLVPTTPIPMIEKGKDRLVLMVRDAFWLHAHWDITRHSVDRARVSIAENWHTAKPILRLIKIDDMATTSNAETVFRDIEIHGGVRNWYIEVEAPGASFQMLMGYLTSNGRFYELARSNIITMPHPGSKEAMDDHWAEIAKNAEKIFAMSGGYSEESNSGDLKEVFEERLKRTMETDVLSQFGSGAEGSLKRNKQFFFNVDAELIVFGNSTPDAHVNIAGEPVKVRPDGTFSLRMPFADKRQVLRISGKSRDGVEEQTVVIAVERNTKVMEPLSLDADEL